MGAHSEFMLAVFDDHEAELVKEASFFDVDDIEDELGITLRGKDLEHAKAEVKKRNSKSFALRHPWLTGIPTLGIWPGISHGRATDKTVRSLKRRSKGMEKAHSKFRAAKRKKREDDYEAQTRRAKSTEMSRSAAHLGTAYLYGKAMDNNRRRR